MKLLLLLFLSFSANAKLIGQLTIEKEKLSTVLVFLSKDCPCSKANLAYINSLASEMKDFQFVAIHSKKNVSSPEIEDFYKENPVYFDMINDDTLALANKYNALKTPHAFIIKDDKVVYNGGITSSVHPDNAKEFFLKDALNDIKQKRLPQKAETKTLGCYISR